MTDSINLYDHSKDRPRRNWTFVVWIGLPLALVSTLGFVSYYQWIQVSMLEQEVEAAEAQTAELKARWLALQVELSSLGGTAGDEERALVEQLAGAQEVLRKLQSATLDEQSGFFEPLVTLARLTPVEIALRRIVLTRGDSVYLAGMARSPTDVALYIGALRESVAFANHAMVPVRVSETEDEEQYRVEVGARAGAD